MTTDWSTLLYLNVENFPALRYLHLPYNALFDYSPLNDTVRPELTDLSIKYTPALSGSTSYNDALWDRFYTKCRFAPAELNAALGTFKCKQLELANFHMDSFWNKYSSNLSKITAANVRNHDPWGNLRNCTSLVLQGKCFFSGLAVRFMTCTIKVKLIDS